MNYNIILILVMQAMNSCQYVIRNCNLNKENQMNGTTNGTNSTGDVQCPSFSQLICPTKCDPSCQKPLIKRSMCSQPITCPKRVCVCGPEYVKDNERKCIPRERCSEKCPSDEIYKLCPPSCEIHCGNVDNPPKTCLEDEREDHECIAGCVCPTGLIRDYNTSKCVKKELCSNHSLKSCPPNEEHRNCSLICDKVCNKENTTCDPNEKNCKIGCFCKKGFIRQNINAKCIAEDNCFTVLKDSDVIEEHKNV